MKQRFVTSALFASLLILLTASWAMAASIVQMVDPVQGALGSTFTITGTGLGTKGQVFVGTTPVTILSWSDTQIQCQIKVPMKAGAYNIYVKPQAKSEFAAGPFTIMPPTVTPPRPRPAFFIAGTQAIIEGSYFGIDRAQTKVIIESLDGVQYQCRIVDWQMGAIKVTMPTGIAGIFNLIITNSAGTVIDAWYGTFDQPPPGGTASMPGGYEYGGDWSANNATGVMYQGKLWVFFPGQNKYIYWRTWDGVDWSAAQYMIDNVDSTHTTTAQINPVVINNNLWIFETREDGAIHVTQYDPGQSQIQGKPIWINMRKISVYLTSTSGRFGAAYNEVTERVELFVPVSVTQMKKLEYNPVTNGYADKGFVPLQMDPNHPHIVPYVTAVWNGNTQDGSSTTYVSWGDADVNGYPYAGGLNELAKDGTVLYQTRLWYWGSRNSGAACSLVDLTEKYLAVIYNHWDTYSSYQKYDKTTHQPVGGMAQGYEIDVPYSSPTACGWAPNGIVVSKKADDASSVTGDHMEMRFYAIVENNPKETGAKWRLVETEYLGFWRPTGPPNLVDFQGSGLSSHDLVNQRLAQTFPQWPIIGLIDMPPFVRNGHGECTDYLTCTTASDIDFTTSQTEGLSGEYSAGAYVESGKKSPVTFSVSTGYAGGFENSKTFSYTTGGGIEENLEGRITAYYLCPSFTVWRLQWFDLNGSPTGIEVNSVQANTPMLRKETFAPDVGPSVGYYNGRSYFTPPYMNVAKTIAETADSTKLPMHAYTDDRTRLNSYFRDPTATPFNYKSIYADVPSDVQTTWAPNSPGDFGWELNDSHSVDNGWYSNIKIGGEIAGAVGFGVEGSIKIMVNSKNETSTKSVTNFRSQAPINYSDPNRVDAFSVTGFWLAPVANSYWVPTCRKSMGDTPWFITFRVPDYQP